MRRRELILLLAIVAAGLCLRAPVIGLSSVLAQIGEDFDETETWLGILSALPLFCFGIAALVSPAAMRRFGDARFLAWCLVVLVAAQVVRLAGGSSGLLGGTLIVGLTIGGANVALPALIKRWFPERIAVATSLCSLSLVIGGSVAAGVALPIQEYFGASWRAPLLVFAVPTGLVAVAWLFIGRSESGVIATVRSGQLWSNRLAWNVTLFLGLQAFCAYAIVSWLPTIAIDRGMAAAEGGALLAVAMAAQAVGTLTLPGLIGRSRDERPAVVVTAAVSAIGFIGLIISPLSLIWVPVVIIGLGTGASFALALALISLRSHNERVAGELSGMAQSVGYIIGGFGPLGIGALRTASGDWVLPIIVVLFFCILMVPVGLRAARNRHV